MGVKGLLRNHFVVTEYCFDNPLSPVREFVVKILLTYLQLLSSINYYENLIKIRGKSLCWLLVILWFFSYFTGNSDDVLIIYCEVKFDGDHFWGLREFWNFLKIFILFIEQPLLSWACTQPQPQPFSPYLKQGPPSFLLQKKLVLILGHGILHAFSILAIKPYW